MGALSSTPFDKLTSTSLKAGGFFISWIEAQDERMRQRIAATNQALLLFKVGLQNVIDSDFEIASQRGILLQAFNEAFYSS